MVNSIVTSIIIPALNEREKIRECIESIQRQEAPFNFEIVVVDGGSTDGTLEYLHELSKKTNINLRVIQEYGEKSPANARNIGWQEARGDVIIFRDADKFSDDNNFLLKMTQPFLNDENLELLYVPAYPTFTFFNVIDKVANYRILALRGKDYVTSIRKRLLKRVGGFKNIGMGDDIEFGDRLRKESIKTRFSEEITTEKFEDIRTIGELMAQSRWYHRTFLEYIKIKKDYIALRALINILIVPVELFSISLLTVGYIAPFILFNIAFIFYLLLKMFRALIKFKDVSCILIPFFDLLFFLYAFFGFMEGFFKEGVSRG